MSFAPRRRKNYIIWKNGRAYYRRIIPAQYREMFGGKTAWVIALKGQGSAALEAEALAYAHKHNQQMSFGEEMPDDAFQPRQGDIMMRVDLRPEDAPPGVNGGAKLGHSGGVKPGQLVRVCAMARALFT